jgi:hypothetical protein
MKSMLKGKEENLYCLTESRHLKEWHIKCTIVVIKPEKVLIQVAQKM